LIDSLREVKCSIVDSRFGEIGIVWVGNRKRAKIIRICLPAAIKMIHVIKGAYPDAVSDSVSVIQRVCRKIEDYLNGSPIEFDLDILDESCLYAFQKEVLWAEQKIPYGRISTYGRLALKIGRPCAARAVGTALARNPFPIIIPCHRIIRADGTLGGYQGGIKLKRALLELEGVQFSRSGSVVLEEVW